MISQSKTASTFTEAIKSILHKRVITVFFFGFSTGIPYILIFSSLARWLTEADISQRGMALLSWVMIAYSLKVLWISITDRVNLPILTSKLGRRRAWLLLTQIIVCLNLVLISFVDPEEDLMQFAIHAIILGTFISAQDTLGHAFRIESGYKNLQGMMAASYFTGYKIGAWLASAGLLAVIGWMSATDGEHYNFEIWANAYQIMVFFVLIGVAATLISSEPDNDEPVLNTAKQTSNQLPSILTMLICLATFLCIFTFLDNFSLTTKNYLETSGITIHTSILLASLVRWICSLACAFIMGWIISETSGKSVKHSMHKAYIAPFTDFFKRNEHAVFNLILFLATYRVIDAFIFPVTSSFYRNVGYIKDQIQLANSVLRPMFLVLGWFVGGIFALRFGNRKALLIGAILAPVSNILFIFLTQSTASADKLYTLVTLDSLFNGFAQIALIAFISELTNRSYTAMQYTLLSGIISGFPQLVEPYAAMITHTLGYTEFFILSTFLGIPLIWLTALVIKNSADRQDLLS